MKKNFIYALMGAIALTGATGFTGCTDEDVVEVNPGYNPETGEVPVKLVLNVSTGNMSTTRMSQGTVQATSDDAFRGMDQSVLMSFQQGSANDGKHVAVAGTANKYYGLGPIFAPATIGPNSDDKSRRILELTLPVATNTLMFWGKATKTEGKDDEQGKVNWGLTDQNLSTISFKLCNRVPDGDDASAGLNTAALANCKALMAAILNAIVQTTYSGTSSYKNSLDVTETKTMTDLTWREYGTKKTGDTYELVYKSTTDADYSDPSNSSKRMCALGETLSKEFVVFNTIYESDGEMRAGSGPAVADMLSSLYSVINSVAEATPTCLEEAVAQNLAIQIRTNINKALSASGTGFLSIDAIKTNLGLTIPITTKIANLIDFPAKFGIPAGGTILSYDVQTNEYSYKGTLPTYDMGGGTNFDVNKYVYPPELCYFGNSPVRVSDTAEKTDPNESIFPQGSVNWDNDAYWPSVWSTTDQSVRSSTNSVAMKNNINYGTALLKTQVKYGADELQDNRAALISAREGATEANQTIDASPGHEPFLLTGILIGGQNREVGWNYLNKGTGTFDTYVYDKDISEDQKTIPSNGIGPSIPVYTLLWDGWDEAKKNTNQHPVYIGLEFKNNSGKDFWGQNNLIPKDGTFYITGVLDPDYASDATLSALSVTADQYKANKSLGITWPTKYALPPYDTDGSTIKERRVFIQDYMTSATFVIGPTSLQKALVSVPDLRSAHLSVGLSVDLHWSTGLNFENVVLGNTTTP